MILLVKDLLNIEGTEEELTLDLIDILFAVAYQTHKENPEEQYIKPFINLLSAMTENHEFEKMKQQAEQSRKDDIVQLSQLP